VIAKNLQGFVGLIAKVRPIVVPMQLDKGHSGLGQPFCRISKVLQTKSPVAPRQVQPLLQTFGTCLLKRVELLLNLSVFLFEMLFTHDFLLYLLMPLTLRRVADGAREFLRASCSFLDQKEALGDARNWPSTIMRSQSCAGCAT